MQRLDYFRYTFFYIELILSEVLQGYFDPYCCYDHQKYIAKAATYATFAGLLL